MDFLTEVSSKHGFHNFPNNVKPGGWINNEEKTDTDRNTSLQHHHELTTIRNTKVGHFPIIHVGHKGNTILTCLLLFHHGIHAVGKVINDFSGGSFFGEVSIWFHVEDIETLTALQSWHRKERLAQQLFFHGWICSSKIEVTSIEFFHHLFGFLILELFGSWTTTSKTKNHFITKAVLLLLTVCLELVKTFLLLVGETFNLLLQRSFSNWKESARSITKLLFNIFRIKKDLVVDTDL
mmetsp:Transcript_21262/g.32707  ORF Transcript_21262/g.32707 Transcript_21262/m.32707 type:complete len:237 (+) Transcript_21262:258-968(+)